MLEFKQNMSLRNQWSIKKIKKIKKIRHKLIIMKNRLKEKFEMKNDDENLKFENEELS